MMNNSRAATYIGDIDMSQITFGPFEDVKGKQKVEVFTRAEQTKQNKLNRIALFRDALHPMTTRFPLDAVRDDKTNLLRRGLGITVDDEKTIKALRDLDETIVKAAVANSKEWFKGKMLTEEQVRLRYKPVFGKLYETDETEGVKPKVKCPGAEWPTILHLRDQDGEHHKNAGTLEHLTKGALVAPIVSASYGLWFMGGGTQFGISFQVEEMIIVPGQAATDDLSQFGSSAPLKMAKTMPTGDSDSSRKRSADEMGDDDDVGNVSKSTKVELIGDDDHGAAM